MGSIGDSTSNYSVPAEARQLLDKEILANKLIPSLPKEIHEAAKHINYTGSLLPSIPINWRFAESVAALKGFEACMINVLRSKKYGVGFDDVTIDTDHASLFFMTPFLAQKVGKCGEIEPVNFFDKGEMERLGFRNTDLHRATEDLQRVLATNIYRTKDGRYYHTHGSLNPEPTLAALNQPLFGEKGDTYDTVVSRIQAAVSQHNAADLDSLMNEQYKQAGTIAWSVDEFNASEHGKANAHINLYSISKAEGSDSQPAAWWPEQPSMPSSPARPLAGLKVVDLTRIIAAPTITRSLAELGASVMRVTSPNVTDMSTLHFDLQWGKWNASLDLKGSEGDREKLRALIREADVVVEGYRPGAMARNGFSREDVYKLAEGRGRGIVHVRENCYGWQGPWMGRSGWQQISDTCCGVSLEYGRAMGHDEAVVPVFPNSDYCTGIAGCTAILQALIRRAEEGGSYGVDSSLDYYSQWLTRSVGTYPDPIWNSLWKQHNNLTFRNYHNMSFTLPAMLASLKENSAKTLFNPDFFEKRKSGAVGGEFVVVRPVGRWSDESVKLEYNVGTRGNGVDAAKWPEDLGVEVVT